jgi:hypothetical protein
VVFLPVAILTALVALKFIAPKASVRARRRRWGGSGQLDLRAGIVIKDTKLARDTSTRFLHPRQSPAVRRGHGLPGSWAQCPFRRPAPFKLS